LAAGDHTVRGTALVERPRQATRRTEGPEVEALRLAVHRPEEVANRLEGVLFADDVHLAAFDALCRSSTLDEAIEVAMPDASALLQRLAVEETEADANDVIVLLVAAAAHRSVDVLQAEARASSMPTDYAATIGWLKVTTEQLWEPQTSVGASDQLVAWLVQFGQEGA
jgi:hypothetical protein